MSTEPDFEAIAAEVADLAAANDRAEEALARQGMALSGPALLVTRVELLIDALLGPVDQEAGTVSGDRLIFEQHFQRRRATLIERAQAEARQASATKDLLVPPGTGKSKGGLHLPGKG